MVKTLPFESFNVGRGSNEKPRTIQLESETPPDVQPFGLELFTTITAPELRLGVVACALSKGTQVDDATGAQDVIERTSPLIIDNTYEARSLY